MGKAKPRHRNRKHNKNQPTGLQNAKDCESEDSELHLPNKDETAIENVIEEIQSANIDDRLCGLQSLITLSEKPESIETILKFKLLKIVAPLLIDKNSEVRNFSAGIIRNLSASGSTDVCERLVKDDVMTPLIALLHQYSDWKPESCKSEDTDTLLQVVNILWNLCETDETALKYFSSANLLNILLRCLDYKVVGLDLSIAVCQCLNSVCEDNATVISALRNHEADLLALLSLASTDNKLLLLKSLVAGIIVTLSPTVAWLEPVLTVVTEVLSAPLRSQVAQLTSRLPLNSTAPLPTETQAALDMVTALTDAQTTALEILTNLCSGQDDEMDLESGDSESEEEEINGWSDADVTQPLSLNPEIEEGLGKFKLVQSVLDKTESLPENIMDILNNCPYSRSLAKKSIRLQCLSFLCFNNLVSVAGVELLGGPQHLALLIKLITSQQLCFNPNQSVKEINLELLEASTSAIRAILLKLASVNYTELEILPTDLEMMCKVGLSSEPRVQANVIRIVGSLAILVFNRDPFVFKMAGVHLLEMSEKQIALWLTAEAIDSLLDMFSDDMTDQIAAEINLVPRLQALAPQLKAKMRQERRTLGDHYPVVSTVMTNLVPFIKYKSARVAAL